MSDRQPIPHPVRSISLPNANGRRPAHGDVKLYETDPHFCDLVLFYEHYDGDTTPPAAWEPVTKPAGRRW